MESFGKVRFAPLLGRILAIPRHDACSSSGRNELMRNINTLEPRSMALKTAQQLDWRPSCLRTSRSLDCAAVCGWLACRACVESSTPPRAIVATEMPARTAPSSPAVSTEVSFSSLECAFRGCGQRRH